MKTRVRVRDYWRWWAVGCSRMGRIVRRNGTVVHCGHSHRQKGPALDCLKHMLLDRPGNCQDYKLVRIHIVESRPIQTTEARA